MSRVHRAQARDERPAPMPSLTWHQHLLLTLDHQLQAVPYDYLIDKKPNLAHGGDDLGCKYKLKMDEDCATVHFV
jgi:hypothetical protein